MTTIGVFVCVCVFVFKRPVLVSVAGRSKSDNETNNIIISTSTYIEQETRDLVRRPPQPSCDARNLLWRLKKGNEKKNKQNRKEPKQTKQNKTANTKKKTSGPGRATICLFEETTEISIKNKYVSRSILVVTVTGNGGGGGDTFTSGQYIQRDECDQVVNKPTNENECAEDLRRRRRGGIC